MLFIGIDPGFDGAVAVLDDDGPVVAVCDTPTLVVTGAGDKSKRVYNVSAMLDILAPYAGIPARVMLEQVHAMPGQGVRSMFVFGEGLGLWQGILAALQIPYEMVPPRRWQSILLHGMGKGKDAARVKAMRLFPTVDLSLKKHAGRADAILLAEYSRIAAGRSFLTNSIWTPELLEAG